MFEGLFQPLHLVVILVIALVVFGPGKLSEIGGSLGKAVRGFKKAMNDPLDLGEGPGIKCADHKDKETPNR